MAKIDSNIIGWISLSKKVNSGYFMPNLQTGVVKWVSLDENSKSGYTKSYMVSANKPYYIKKDDIWEVKSGYYEFIHERNIPSALRFIEGGPKAIRKLVYTLTETE